MHSSNKNKDTEHVTLCEYEPQNILKQNISPRQQNGFTSGYLHLDLHTSRFVPRVLDGPIKLSRLIQIIAACVKYRKPCGICASAGPNYPHGHELHSGMYGERIRSQK